MCHCEVNLYACATDAGSKHEDGGISDNEDDNSKTHDEEHDHVDITEDNPEGNDDVFTLDYGSYLPEDTSHVFTPNGLPFYNRHTSPF